MVFKFQTLRLSVVSVRKSASWYESFLGIRPHEISDHFASFQVGLHTFDLAQADGKSPTSKGGSVGYWLVDDLDKALSCAKNLGARIHRGPLRVEEIGRTIVQIEDPFGSIIGLEG